MHNREDVNRADKDRYNEAMDRCIPRDTPGVHSLPTYYRLAERYTTCCKNEPWNRSHSNLTT
jgi:hypothetical protein